MGVLRAGKERPELNPEMGKAIRIQEGDKLVLLGDAY